MHDHFATTDSYMPALEKKDKLCLLNYLRFVPFGWLLWNILTSPQVIKNGDTILREELPAQNPVHPLAMEDNQHGPEEKAN